MWPLLRDSTNASAVTDSGRAALSIGDYICNGGEVAAMVVIDTVIRYACAGALLGDENSVTEESHSVPGRVEYPQNTPHRVFREMAVPEVLLSGDHKAIARWRARQADKRGAEINDERKIPENGDKDEKIG